jgi:hypothetical protein
MNKMLDRVEALEEIIQPQAECSPWLRGALDPMTDEECKDVERFILAAMLRRQDGTTSAQREAFEKFARKEAELKEEAVSVANRSVGSSSTGTPGTSRTSAL